MSIKSNHSLFYLKLFAVAFVIFGARLWLIHNFGSSVPFWDQWDSEAAFLFLPWLNDGLVFSDLFAVHNEHRIFFTRIQALLLLILNEGQWNPLLEMVVNALLATLTAIVLIVILNHLLERTVENLILISIALLWTLPYGWANTLAGFQSAFYFMMLFNLIAVWGLLLHDNFSLKWWIGVIFALSAIFTVASGFFILLVLIVIKLYLIAIDTGNRRSHLPTLFVCIIITTISMMLLNEVAHHAPLKASNVTEFMLAFGKNLAWPWVTYPFASLILYLPFLALVFRIL